MKKLIVLFQSILLLLSLCACGKQEAEEAAQPSAPSDAVIAVKITPNNLFQYFEYREYPSLIRGEENTDIISRAQVSYGLALREGFTAANSPEYKDTMQVTFTADGIIKSGEFNIDFNTLQYSGTEYSSQRQTITETLAFWPKGDRTFVWTYGNYSKSNILYLENFRVVSASGTVYLRQTGASE